MKSTEKQPQNDHPVTNKVNRGLLVLDYMEKFRVAYQTHIRLACFEGTSARQNCNRKVKQMVEKGYLERDGRMIILPKTPKRTFHENLTRSELHAQILAQLPAGWWLEYFGCEEEISDSLRPDAFFIVRWPDGGLKAYVEIHGPKNRRFPKPKQYAEHMRSGAEARVWHAADGWTCSRVLVVCPSQMKTKLKHLCKKDGYGFTWHVATVEEVKHNLWSVLGVDVSV